MAGVKAARGGGEIPTGRKIRDRCAIIYTVNRQNVCALPARAIHVLAYYAAGRAT